MKVMFDSNVIIDALTERDNNYKSSRQLIRYVVAGSIKGYITAKQVTDIYYSVRKYYSNKEQIKGLIRIILNTFEILPTIKSDIAYSMNSQIEDLEDALIDEVCAVNCVQNLVTNNAKDFEKAKSTIWTPNQLLSIIEVGRE